MKFYYYQITNTKNGNFYIGITTNPEKRERQHFTQLERGAHANYKMQKDYDIFGQKVFRFEVIEELEASEEQAYLHEYELIQKYQATQFYNISEGGHINPVHCPQVVEKLKVSHQKKYDNILQYSFDGHNFHFVAKHNGIRDACRNTDCDFRGIQNAIKKAQAHHDFYWVKENKKDEWMSCFLKRHTCCVAKINETTGQIEDTALTIAEFAEKYNTTYNRIYSSIRQNNRCERKYKFVRITAEEFAEINNLSL